MQINRRDFIRNSAMAGPALLFTGEERDATPWTAPPAPGFELRIMATNWGYAGDAASFCATAKKEGYDGIEVWMPGDQKARDEIANAAARNGLLMGLLYGGSDADPSKHLRQFREGITAAAALKPIYINCHSGRDHFSVEQNRGFMTFTSELSSRTGIPVYHETHRGRSLFAAHVTREYLERIPDLRLTLDISHWCTVHESTLEDQEANVALALGRTDHIHARIGHSEGPQVNDPRSPEWDEVNQRHLGWWDEVVKRKRKEGSRMTILTEFGPPYYLPTVPYTRQPLANQWEINVHMMQLLRKRYG